MNLETSPQGHATLTIQEPQCKDGEGSSPCAVIDPVGTNYDRVIGQWDDNKISATDAEKARLVYGVKTP